MGLGEALKRTAGREAHADVLPLVISGMVAGALACLAMDWEFIKFGTPLRPFHPDLISTGIVLLGVGFTFKR